MNLSPRSPASQQDRTLARRLRDGDEGALEAVLADYRPLLLAYLRSLLSDRAEAEDVLQQALLDAWRHCASFDPERGSVRNWLLLICRSRATDRLRRRVPEPHDPAALLLHEAANPDSEAEVTLERWRIADALRRLPAREGQLLRLRFYEELSQQEIAKRTGLPLGTVKTTTLRALRRLREILEEEQP